MCGSRIQIVHCLLAFLVSNACEKGVFVFAVGH